MRINDQEYFLRQSSSGMVGGPASGDGVGRHITVAVNNETEKISNVHMKSGRGTDVNEDWRIYPDEIMHDLTSWVRDNSVPLRAVDVATLDESSYVISIRRAFVTFHILEALLTRLGWLLFRGMGFAPMRIVENGRKTWILVEVNPERIQRRMRQLAPIGKPFLIFVRASLPNLLERIMRLHLIKLKGMSEGDVCLVFPRGRSEPAVVFKSDNYLSIPMERVMREATALYSKLKIEELRPRLDLSPSKPIRMEFALRR